MEVQLEQLVIELRLEDAPAGRGAADSVAVLRLGEIIGDLRPEGLVEVPASITLWRSGGLMGLCPHPQRHAACRYFVDWCGCADLHPRHGVLQCRSFGPPALLTG